MTRAPLLALGLAACRPTPPAEPAVTPPSGALPPSRHAAGEVVEANVPLQHGGVLGLAELRGKLVVLELVDAAHRDPAIESEYAALQADGDGRLAVVMVSLDADGWGGDVPPFVLGWDPQGALAARLHAAGMPCVLLLDAGGRIVAQYSGARSPGHGQLVAAARAALPTIR
jgi:hypothetical protein